MAVFIEIEASRCLNCKSPMCTQHCPVSTPIPKVIRMFRENRILDAGAELFANNPMSLFCSIVCNHEDQCTGHCVLGKKNMPVHFYEIEKFISETYLSRINIEKPAPNGKNIAVIGSGPAGLTVAILMAQKGYHITIFERKDKIGGMLRYGIPDFRLPRGILDKYQTVLAKLDVQVRLNTTIGGALKIDTLLNDGYDAVFVGTGVWRPNTLGIPGESHANVHFGISYLENPHNQDLGENVLVIGMGNVAMDVARTAFRNGARNVKLFSRDNRATASTHEMDYAKLDGAEFIYSKQIVKITQGGAFFQDSILDSDGNIIGLGEESFVPSDSVIIAVSQRPKDKLILSTDHLEGSSRGLLVINKNHMTTRDRVFAGGDVVTGPKTVAHAVHDAKEAAEEMDIYLKSL